MAAPTVIPPGGGEVVGDSPDRRVEILCDDDALHVTWSRFGPRRDGADPHIHREHTDFFYVLEGELTLRLGAEDEPVVVPAGQLAGIPPFVVHGFRNGSDAEVKYLNLHAPGCGFAGYMRGVRDGVAVDFDQYDPPADGVRPASEAIVGDAAVEQDAVAIREVRLNGAAAPHGHGRAWFYVLEGELALSSGDHEVHAHEGTWIRLAPGAPYAVAAAGSEPVRFLSIGA